MENLKFLSEIGKLKDVTRTGWELRKVSNPESVADHSFRLALMAMIYSKELGFDENKLIKMALIHDIQEVYTDDIATRADEKNQVVTNKEKIRLEKEAFEKLIIMCPNKNDIIEIWEELQKEETEEAKFIDDLDKVEMVLQALDYKKEHRNGEDLEEFFQTSGPRMKTKKGKELWNKIREDYLKEK